MEALLYTTAVILIFIFLPDSFLEKIFLIFKSKFEDLRDSKLNSGEALLEQLSILTFEAKRGKVQIRLIDYKFWTDLLRATLKLWKAFGISLPIVTKTIRGYLLTDIRFEKRLKAVVKGGYAQFFMISLTTWVFIFLSLKSIQLKSITHLYLIGVMQVVGVFFFIFLSNVVKKVVFSDFDKLIPTLLKIRVLMSVRVGISDILKISKIKELEDVRKNNLRSIVKQIYDLIEFFKSTGSNIDETLEDILERVFFELELQFENYEKFINGAKFLTLVIFYMSSYLIHIFMLLGSFNF